MNSRELLKLLLLLE